MIRFANKTIIYLFLFIFLLSCSKTDDRVRNKTKVDSLLQTARDSLNHNNEYARLNILKALKIAKDSDDFYYAYTDYANYRYTASTSFDSVLQMTKRIISYAKKQTDKSVASNHYTNGYNLAGNCHCQLCNFDSAIHYYSLALEYCNFSSEKQKAPDIYINLADMNVRKGEYVNGIFYYRKALAISDSLHLTEKFGFPVYFGLGQAYFMGLRNFELSDLYFKKAEKLYATRTLTEKFIFCNNRGNYYYYKEEYKEALPWFRKAKALVTPANNLYFINLCDGNMGDVFLNINQLDSADYYTNKSYTFFSSIQNEDVVYYLNTVKAGIALKKRQEAKAFTYLTAPTKLQHIEPLFLSIRNKYLQEYYEQTGNYQKAFWYLKNNTRQNDSLRTERINNRMAEIDMRFQQDTSRIRQQMIIGEQYIKISNLQKANIMWGALLILFIVASIFIYLYIAKKRALQKATLSEMNNKLRLQNIRNRISPHFIFNVLNREISSEEDEVKHQQMIGLVKFLRRSLEITEQTAVSLSDEIEFVKNYLQIEKDSLGDDFSALWDIDGKIKLEDWLIPAMIIQIPVENALKHALRTKSGEKRLNISISRNKDRILISISDNGDGYYPAKALSSKGTGTGLKVLYQSIDLLNAKNSEQITLSVSNLQDTTNTGTLVEISVPHSYIFD